MVLGALVVASGTCVVAPGTCVVGILVVGIVTLTETTSTTVNPALVRMAVALGVVRDMTTLSAVRTSPPTVTKKLTSTLSPDCSTLVTLMFSGLTLNVSRLDNESLHTGLLTSTVPYLVRNALVEQAFGSLQ